MLFAIQPAAMNGAEGVLNALDAILIRAEDDVHEISIVQADLLEQSAWYRSSRRDRKKLLEEIAEASIHRAPRVQGPHLRQIEVSDEAGAREGQSLAYAPLLVLLENDNSDALLIKTALLIFSLPRTQELCFGEPAKLDPPAFSMESWGGHGELKKHIPRCLEQAAERGRRPRLVVVTDSEGEWVGDVKEHALNIRAECAAKGVPCPPLNKRTAENYIPDEVWRAWAAVREHTNARPAVEALLRLSPEQRDHMHLAAANADPWVPGSRGQAKSWLLALTPETDGKALRSHQVSDDAWKALFRGDHRAFVEERTRTLMELERRFMADKGVVPPKVDSAAPSATDVEDEVPLTEGADAEGG